MAPSALSPATSKPSAPSGIVGSAGAHDITLDTVHVHGCLSTGAPKAAQLSGYLAPEIGEARDSEPP